MSSVEGESQNPRDDRLTESTGFLALLAAEECMRLATDRQLPDPLTRYIMVQVLDDTAYYAVTLTSSYQDLLDGRPNVTTVELLVPAMGIDVTEPIVESLTHSPTAYFLLRDSSEKSQRAPLKIDIKGVHIHGEGRAVLRIDEIPDDERVVVVAGAINTMEIIPARLPQRSGSWARDIFGIQRDHVE